MMKKLINNIKSLDIRIFNIIKYFEQSSIIREDSNKIKQIYKWIAEKTNKKEFKLELKFKMSINEYIVIKIFINIVKI